MYAPNIFTRDFHATYKKENLKEKIFSANLTVERITTWEISKTDIVQ